MTTGSLRAPSEGRAPAAAAGEAPRVWALLARRPGDNSQVVVLAEASGLGWAPKRLEFRKGWEALPNLRRGGSLFSLTRGAQAALREPPPAVVIAAGKRSAPAALWLKAATGARLVHLGRTWAPSDWFDLVITTPQYRQPDGPNVVVNRFPLTPTHETAPPRADLAALPRPRLLVIVGGDASGLALDAKTARRLIRGALDRQARDGGSLLVATSPRTSARAVAALRSELALSNAPRRLSVFGEGANEYGAFLSAADALLVTEDSVSMVAEAAMTGRPVALFPLPVRGSLSPVDALTRSGGFTARLVELGVIAQRPDLKGYAASLARDGLLDGGGSAADRMSAELACAADRVRALARRGPGGSSATVSGAVRRGAGAG
ncbi:mitochondrial fission ELM1 family protein [Hansschlegelia sp. KR7-227]|uniref:mitochondrial fission ELM1 family protein n=1 Tax=Hansschlegelia sp. KR7-227 TaxID=3400914 RepID=UPI003C079B7E